MAWLANCSMPVYQEQYNSALAAGSCIAGEVKYGAGQGRNHQGQAANGHQGDHGSELAIKCYTRAMEL